MAVLQMQRISICALKKDRKGILEKLQAFGAVEISPVAVGEEGFSTMDTAGARAAFEKQAQLIESALTILDTYAPEKRSMFAGLEGKTIVSRTKLNQVAADKEALLAKAEQINVCSKGFAEDRANILKLSNQIETLTPWLSLEVPMNFSGTKRIAMLLGTMPSETTLESVYAVLAQHCPEVEEADVQIIQTGKDAVYLAVFCMKENAAVVEEALRTAGFVRPAAGSDVKPAEQKERLLAEIEKLNQQIKEKEEEIRTLAGSRQELQILEDYYRMRAEKYEVLGQLPQTERTFLVSGYIPARSADAVQKAVADAYDCVIDIQELAEDEEPPVVLQNNAFSSSVEGVLESYGLPHKGEVDPTTIMSFFYVFFFGMMLSDAAYGAVIAIACFVMLKKFPRMDRGMHQMLKMFGFCGISTIVWGVLFGGYFGNVVDIVSETFFGQTVTVPALWFIPLNNPMRLLVYSLLFGLIHLFVGLGIGGYSMLKEKRYLDFFCDVILWYIFILGLVLMLIPTDIFASIAQAKIVFPAALNALAKGMAIFGAAGIVLMSGRANKNPALRIALGLYDLYNVTGWLSDVLSYSRLLALGLATGVIASVINQMGSMFGKGIVGVIGFAIVFVIGHILNLAINVLGAYVHTNRLQFVEFFGKFYEGGGKPFTPFHSDTKYVEIKEEN